MTQRMRTAATLAWIVAFGAAVTSVILSFTGLADPPEDGLVEVVIVPSIIVAFATTGLALVFRVPDNRIGWIYLAAGLGGGIWIGARQYHYAALDQGWPLSLYGATLSYAAYTPWILLMVALPMLLFPDGRLPSRRWRWLLWTVSTAITVHIFLALFAGFPPGHEFADLTSPFQSDAIRSFAESNELLLIVATFGLLVVSLLGSVVALVVRFRRAVGVERQQLKWLALAASVAGVGLVVVFTIGNFSGRDPVGGVVVVALLGVLGIPVATGLAIVRYRLYDIDRLISRTLVYGLLVVLLAGVYAAGVFVVGSILPAEDGISVAVSTLAVAALFNPGRKRLQRVIDRRFFRAQYDAREVVESLSVRLRDEVDLETVQEKLLEAVDETVKPATSAVWIRTDS